MNKSHRCDNGIHDREYKYKYSQHSVTLPMPPGDLTNNVSDSNSPEPRPASAVSKMEHQFGRETSNEWGYYHSDTSSYTSSHASSSRSRILPPPSSSQFHMHAGPLSFQDTYRHPRGQSLDEDCQSDRDSLVITLRREKNHFKHKVSKLEAKVISLEGELSSSHKLYAQLLEKLSSLQIAPAGSDASGSFSTTTMDSFMALLKDV
ncbi:hypothetical protein PAXRUDRAFT_18126 [Paxillus rubicundulus Ve08.2h10]|uniref:Uncharacterized protein n=1 Tax=Paxillus rubicundulus Ve08.2h10 TaxID=930991 RepID=A0A0D0CMN3_9AGAM|nr:hypothetical protein PAXRUDRAFT_18126 [Paxillus rubicundulus Ve08.2h10]